MNLGELAHRLGDHRSALSTCDRAREIVIAAGDDVLARVFTYSGRDADTMPPVWAARTPDEGVVIGACIVSAATATEVGATGVKRAPWANAPFIPGALGDYMEAQFKFFGSEKIKKEYKGPPDRLAGFAIGKLRGKADPQKTRAILEQLLAR